MPNVKPSKRRIKGTGWTGVWLDGTPGWFTTEHVYDGTSWGHKTSNPNAAGCRFYRCEITVRLLRDKRGRFIVRRAPALQPEGESKGVGHG